MPFSICFIPTNSQKTILLNFAKQFDTWTYIYILAYMINNLSRDVKLPFSNA